MKSHRFGLTWAASAVSLALVVLLGAAAPGRPAYAAAATYTVTARSAYLRDTPVSGAPATYSVFMGQTYPITGRTADSAWVRLDMAGANKGTWILAAFGTIAGTLNSVPAEGGQPVAAEGAGAISASPTAAAAAGGDTASVSNQRLTITAASAYARGAPAWTAAKVASLFRGQTFTVTGRDPSSQWLQVLLPGEAWVSVGVGMLSGHMSALPIIGAPPVVAGRPDASAPTDELGMLPAWIPVLTPHMRDIYARAAQHGLNRAIFSVAGDCNSEANIYAELIAYDLIDLTNHPYLRRTARYFKAATFHKSYAVAGGFNAASIMDPVWSDPQFCQRGESPFACELRTTKSSVVFIQLGTGDQFQWEDFETNYRVPIEYALNAGVLPVLVTKVDALESIEGGAPEGYINSVIRRLGIEYDVPVVDLWQATQGLRNGGLTDEPGHDFHLNAEAIGLHVISTLQMLHRLLNG